jgi:hypothetical protein
MVGTRGAQPLSYDLRLPDAAQADALRLLNASRAVINQALITLWPHLDEFAAERSGPAWKQVDALLPSPEPLQPCAPWEPAVALRGGGGRSHPARPG